jgi:hypothetical protein
MRFHHWIEFFSTSATDWHSLNGELVAESFGGHLRLTAAVDRVGHVALRTQLRGVDSLSRIGKQKTLSLQKSVNWQHRGSGKRVPMRPGSKYLRVP